jgi:hypothetical protein
VSPDDFDAIRVWLRGTNDERDGWFRYSPAGECGTILLELASDAESPLVIHIHARVPPTMDRDAETTLSLAGSYVITEPSLSCDHG